MITVTHLTKQYGGTKALYDVNFTIQKGEVVGFLGPNGAGKSTTMNMLCGYLTPSWGEVKIAGFDMQAQPLEAKKHIGYLPEIPPLYMDMTVAEQLSFACELRGLKLGKQELRDYIHQLCLRTRIEDTEDRLIRNLSKGYRQRVAVTQLLVGEPEILILDEPTVGLDPRQIREFRDLLTDLAKEHTIILSSHILSEISSVCSRILVFCEGMLIADGKPQQLQEQIFGCRVLETEIRGDRDAVGTLLRNLPDVLSVEEREQNCYQIMHRNGTDIRSAVYQALKQTDYELMMMRPEEFSLENLYLYLTGDEQENEE